MIPEPLLRVAFVSIVIFLAAVVFLFIVRFLVWLFPEEDISSYVSVIDAKMLWTRSVHAQWYAQPPLQNE